MVPAAASEFQRHLPALGTLVSKMFGDTRHVGEVTRLCLADQYPVTVKYQDGDGETYSLIECHQQLSYDDAVSRRGLTRRFPTVFLYGNGVPVHNLTFAASTMHTCARPMRKQSASTETI